METQTNSSATDKVSVAFSGSGFKFPAHLGGLKALQDCNKSIVEVAGVSGGSIVAGLFACGQNIDELTKTMLAKNWIPFYQFNPFNFITRGGLVGGDDIEKYLTDMTGGKTFADITTPLTILATNLLNGEEYVFSKSTTPDCRVATAIRASISIPGIFCPVRLNDDVLLVDGCVVNSLPMNHLKYPGSMKMGIKLVHTGSEQGPHVTTPMPDSVALAVNVIKQSVFVMADRHDEWAFTHGFIDNVVRLNCQYADPLDPNIPKDLRIRLFKDGYTQTRNFIEFGAS